MVQLHNEQKQVRGTAGGREASPQQHLQFKASPALHDNNYDFRAEPVHVPYLSLYVVRARVCSPLASPGRAAPKEWWELAGRRGGLVWLPPYYIFVISSF